MTYGEFLQMFVTEPKPDDQRWGQWFFNELLRVRPDVAQKIRATPNDPFHNDNILEAAYTVAEELWKETP